MKRFNWKLGRNLHFYLFSLFMYYSCSPNKGGQQESQAFTVVVNNNSELVREEVLISIDAKSVSDYLPEAQLNEMTVFDGNQEVQSQLSNDNYMFMVNLLEPKEAKKYTLRRKTSQDPVQSFPKRTQAELSIKKGGYFENQKYIGGEFENITYLRIPDEHTDHSFFIRYEGPGWESDLVGYRFYQDWRRATDVFGKKTNQMIMQHVGLDGFDSYHEMQPWGMDVLKVGSSLGLGTLATFNEGKALRIDKTDSVRCEIIENGMIYSAIESNYFGWKVAGKSVDVESVLSIHAGSRLTHHEIRTSGQLDNMCTGIRKDKNASLFTEQGDASKWGYIATYGVQSLNNDNLGLAVFFSNDLFKGFTEDEHSHVVKLNPGSGMLDYYFLAAWEGENNGIQDEKAFMNYIKKTAKELANPVRISINHN